jgi:hypothetical protein
MDNQGPLILVLVLFIVIILLVAWMPRLKAMQSERERSRSAEMDRLQKERESHLNSIISGAPRFIHDERRDFELNYRASNGGKDFPNEMSPLVCFGYRVGKSKGRPEHERRSVLRYALAANLDTELSFLQARYRSEWGCPLSIKRFNRIYQHLIYLTELHAGKPNLGRPSHTGVQMPLGSTRMSFKLYGSSPPFASGERHDKPQQSHAKP